MKWSEHACMKWHLNTYRYTPYSTRMSTHTLMGIYKEVLVLGVIRTCTFVHGFCFFKAIFYTVYRDIHVYSGSIMKLKQQEPRPTCTVSSYW